jgi:hypothetical protein
VSNKPRVFLRAFVQNKRLLNNAAVSAVYGVSPGRAIGRGARNTDAVIERVKPSAPRFYAPFPRLFNPAPFAGPVAAKTHASGLFPAGGPLYRGFYDFFQRRLFQNAPYGVSVGTASYPSLRGASKLI